MANPEDGKKKAHDMTVIKRSSADQLRNGAGKGRKVMLVWDKAHSRQVKARIPDSTGD
jgi:hypothetical protein